MPCAANHFTPTDALREKFTPVIATPPAPMRAIIVLIPTMFPAELIMGPPELPRLIDTSD
jgi:hypothetical protein